MHRRKGAELVIWSVGFEHACNEGAHEGQQGGIMEIQKC